MNIGLGLLEERERIILERFYGLGRFEESSICEIAASLGISETRVKHIKADVLRRMRGFLLDLTAGVEAEESISSAL
jgi:DNA-directed RNA polymerase specialized sigma subunit